MVYDITSEKSFDNIVNYWLRHIKEVSVCDCMEVRKGVVKNYLCCYGDTNVVAVLILQITSIMTKYFSW